MSRQKAFKTLNKTAALQLNIYESTNNKRFGEKKSFSFIMQSFPKTCQNSLLIAMTVKSFVFPSEKLPEIFLYLIITATLFNLV